MEVITPHSETGQRILQLFGIETKNVKEAHIHFLPLEPITVDIVKMVEIDGEILDELERKTFILTEKEE